MQSNSRRKKSTRFAIVLVTAPDLKTASNLAKAALQARLTACANLVPRLKSHYWWKGKIERSTEVLILFKTTMTCLARLEHLVLQKHPYDTPEFVVLSLSQGNQRYLDWLKGAVAIE